MGFVVVAAIPIPALKAQGKGKIMNHVPAKLQALNVMGGRLEICSLRPLTGFWRDGCCNTGKDDAGRHVICVQLTAEFLAFTKARGNDLSTPRPEYQFPGLQPGDRWCLCALRFKEALRAGCAPKVWLEATHEVMLSHVTLEQLRQHALDVH